MSWRMDNFQVFPIAYVNFISFFICNSGLNRRGLLPKEYRHAEIFVIYTFKVSFMYSDFRAALFYNYCRCCGMIIMTVSQDYEFQVCQLYILLQLFDNKVAVHSRIDQDFSIYQIYAGIVGCGANVPDFHSFSSILLLFLYSSFISLFLFYSSIPLFSLLFSYFFLTFFLEAFL